jgi:hypothetical protein
MDPAFPDIVGEWAKARAAGPANDNQDEEVDDFAELFLLEIARRHVEASRDW